MSFKLYRQVLLFVIHQWGYHLRLVSLIFFGLMVIMIADVMVPVAAKNLVDTVSGVKQVDDLHAAAWSAIGLLLLPFVVAHTMRQVAWRGFIYLQAHCMARLTQTTFERVQRFSTDWHANNFAGATVRKITRGMWAFDTLGDTLMIGIIPTILVLTGMTVMLTLISPLLGLFAGVSVVVFVLVSGFVSIAWVAPSGQEMADQDSKLGGALADAVTCNPVVKAFGAESREDGRLGKETGLWRYLAKRCWNRHMDAGLIQSVMQIAMLAGLVSIAVMLWMQGRATPGDVALAMTTYFMINAFLREIGMHVRNLQQGVNDIEDMVIFAEQPHGVADRPQAERFAPGSGRIVFDGVTFGYSNQPDAVYQDFSIRINPGEKVALVGKSGSGKSTFVKLVQRLYDVQSGRILIDDQDVAGVTQESLRAAIALVPQEPILFHRSLADNIAYAKPGATHEEIVEAAKRAHAHEFIMRLRDGYDTLVGERGVKLSGGERQRIAIARAFLADAPILILDEATSSLDSVTEQHIQNAIEDLMEGRTTILIAHRLSTIQRVDRILVFHEGSIVEQGTHTELLARPTGHYKRLYATQHQHLDLLAG